MAQGATDDPLVTADLSKLRDAWKSAQEELLQNTAAIADPEFREIVLKAVEEFKEGKKPAEIVPETVAETETVAATEEPTPECGDETECEPPQRQ